MERNLEHEYNPLGGFLIPHSISSDLNELSQCVKAQSEEGMVQKLGYLSKYTWFPSFVHLPS